MPRYRNTLRWTSWVAIVAILGNVMAGALGRAPAWAGVAGLDDTVAAHLMCVGGAPGQPEAPGGLPGGHEDSDGKAHCALCTVLAGFALAVALAFAAIAFPSAGVFSPLRFDLTTLAHQLSRGGMRSRAPPCPA
jgi:hypothetical protein